MNPTQEVKELYSRLAEVEREIRELEEVALSLLSSLEDTDIDRHFKRVFNGS